MREKKKESEDEDDDLEEPRKIDYKDAACLLCGKVHTLSLYLRMRERDILLCRHCATDLKSALNEGLL